MQVSSISELDRLPPETGGLLVVAFGSLPLVAVIDRAIGFQQPVVIGIHWVVAAIVLGGAVAVEDVSLGDVGFRRPAWVDVGYFLGTTIAALAVFVFVGPLIEGLGVPTDEATGGIGAEPDLVIGLVTAVTIGVVEEILYRGYAIERLLAYTDSAVVAGGLTWIAFVVAHTVVWPLDNLLQIAAVSVVFIAIYLRRRRLAPVVGAHVCVWVLPVLAAAFG